MRLHVLRRHGRVRLEVRVRAYQRHEASTSVTLMSLEDGCAAGCAVQEGRRAVGEASSGGMQPRRSAPCYVLCCRAARDALARHDHRGCGQALGVPPHSTAQAAACRFVEESGGSRGRWSRVRRSRERCGCRLRCSSVGNVRWWGVAMVGSAPERGDGGEGAVFSSVNCLRLRRVFVLFT